jgi:hypothetical protein
MNCRFCLAYIREKNTCPGCRAIVNDKSKSRLKCIVKNCEHVLAGGSGSCYDCDKLPCTRLKQLDKRYRLKYGMSMLQNLDFIKKKGIEAFVVRENKRWVCPNCGAVLCIHRENCTACGHKWHEAGVVFLGD